MALAHRTITTKEASLKTATVEVKALTLNGKQMTLSVYKQLYSEPLMDTETTHLTGVPWGKVNYFPGDCVANHLHIVWQKGEELRRACVYPAPWYLSKTLSDPPGMPVEIQSKAVEAGLNRLADLVRTWFTLLLLIGQPEPIQAVLRPGFCPSWQTPAMHLRGQEVWNLDFDGIAIFPSVSEPMRAALYDLMVGNDIDIDMTGALSRLLKELVKAVPTLADADLVTAEAAYAANVQAQLKQLRDFRDQWRAQYDALDALDHLFIAV